ncbi:protein TBATA isoform X1 [Anguilla anguilla]|uniref:protein TBATA isoform X1 n=2 Tax=Anguilla anguilla TaxID=7936 RepID=UPI0015A93F1F|nr:protein TBATA isoform X1 [Anguilla anguilla]
MEPSDKMLVETNGHPVTFNFHHQGTRSSARKAEDVSLNDPLRAVPGMTAGAAKGSPRFGTLSHHSFFSRHNPHPSRVTHIRGLNGNPVCIVNDDWHVSTPLSPHPFIKSQLPWATFGSPAIQIPFMNFSGHNAAHHNAETWREELKDLAAKVVMSASASKDKKTAEEEPARRRTQYSAQTGRIVPPASQASGRRSSRHARPRGPPHPVTLHDQELMVLELLCQILQTDSLSHVQQWLLYAGQREKDMVMCLIQNALDGSVLNSQDQAPNQGGTPISPLSLPSRASSTGQHWGNRRLSSSRQVQDEINTEEKAERIGTAEVLRLHSSEGPFQGENGIPGGSSGDNQL